ncbi:hypothetical protein ACOMHN_004570 [Nucella lapillus]
MWPERERGNPRRPDTACCRSGSRRGIDRPPASQSRTPPTELGPESPPEVVASPWTPLEELATTKLGSSAVFYCGQHIS